MTRLLILLVFFLQLFVCSSGQAQWRMIWGDDYEMAFFFLRSEHKYYRWHSLADPEHQIPNKPDYPLETKRWGILPEDDIRAAVQLCGNSEEESAAYVFIGNKYDGEEYKDNQYVKITGAFFDDEFNFDRVSSVTDFGLPSDAVVDAAFCGHGSYRKKAFIVVGQKFYRYDFGEDKLDPGFKNGKPLEELIVDLDDITESRNTDQETPQPFVVDAAFLSFFRPPGRGPRVYMFSSDKLYGFKTDLSDGFKLVLDKNFPKNVTVFGLQEGNVVGAALRLYAVY